MRVTTSSNTLYNQDRRSAHCACPRDNHIEQHVHLTFCGCTALCSRNPTPLIHSSMSQSHPCKSGHSTVCLHVWLRLAKALISCACGIVSHYQPCIRPSLTIHLTSFIALCVCKRVNMMAAKSSTLSNMWESHRYVCSGATRRSARPMRRSASRASATTASIRSSHAGASLAGKVRARAHCCVVCTYRSSRKSSLILRNSIACRVQ